MELNLGKPYVYPGKGVVKVAGVERRRMPDGREVDCYLLELLSDQSGRIFVPIENVDKIGFRHTVEQSRAQEILDQLLAGEFGNRLKQPHEDVLRDDGLRGLARVFAALYKRFQEARLSPKEAKLLRSVTDQLVGELAVSLRADQTTIIRSLQQLYRC